MVVGGPIRRFKSRNARVSVFPSNPRPQAQSGMNGQMQHWIILQT
jgi:hypothetical protein